jgi:hypothetical protein
VIIAWVLSLILLLSALVHHLERLAALEVVSVNTYLKSHQQFIAAEKALLECEQHFSNIAGLENTACHVQSAGKNLWLISSKEKPVLEVLVFLDEQTGLVTRLNWRQQFE